MRKEVLLSIALFCFCSSLISQQRSFSDSLKYYNKIGLYVKALPFAIQQYEAAKSLEENDTIRIAAVFDLGFGYYQLGKYDSALVYLARVSEAYKKLYGGKNLEYAKSLSDLASAYKNTGQYEIAERLFQESLSLKKALLGEGPDYALTLNQLGLLHFTLGEYGKAEDEFLKQCNILKKVSEKTADYARAAGNLALVYSRVGNFVLAEKLQLQVLEIRKEILGEKHPMYGLALSNLGTVYANMGNYVKSDSLQTISLAVIKQSLGENHPQYLRGLHNLGVNSTILKKYAPAESFYLQAIEGWRRIYGEDDPDYLFMFDALSNLYSKMGQKKRAAPLFLQSLARYDKLQLSQHPYRLDLLYHIVDLYLATRAPAEALLYLTEAMQVEKNALLDKLDFLSEKELLLYLQKRTRALSLSEPYLFLLQNQSPSILKAAYNNRLLFTGVAVQNIKSLTKHFSTSKDSSLTTRWKEYQNNKLLLNKLLSIPVTKRAYSTDSVNEITNQQEKNLLRISAEYRQIKKKLNTTWEEVRNNLKEDEASIEFVKFDYYDSTGKKDSVCYAAMLLRLQDSIPCFIPLFEEKQLMATLKTFAYKSQLRGIPSSNLDASNRAINDNIYKLVWQPLEPYLTNSKKIFFSPDGILHQVAFAAIPYKKDSLLCDKYNLIQLTSTRQIATTENKPPHNNTIALFGGINYNKQSIDSSKMIVADVYAYVYQQNRGIETDSFRFLPNTLKEVTVIKKEGASTNKNIALFTGSNATEQAFRQLGSTASPHIIHFATHGFTLPNKTINKDAANTFHESEDPLLRCGLVMAGGNKGWKGKALADEDDGILTGLEISSMSLPNTELVVLSACETGLGQLMETEGVFGLQRAFKLAGANYVMATLWQVPDKETAEFMEYFYNHWLSGKTIRQAFLNTQQAFRKKYSPFYWAGFTLVQ